jgi:hypothetical protein
MKAIYFQPEDSNAECFLKFGDNYLYLRKSDRLAMPEQGGNQFLKKGVERAGGDRNVTAIGKGDHAQGVIQSIFKVTLPGTTVMARTSNSGEFKASLMARASSVPGSVSIIAFLAAAAGSGSAAIRSARGTTKVK